MLCSITVIHVWTVYLSCSSAFSLISFLNFKFQKTNVLQETLFRLLKLRVVSGNGGDRRHLSSLRSLHSQWTGPVFQQTARRRPADEDICPLDYKSPKTDGETAIFRLDRTSPTGSCSVDRQNEERGEHTEISWNLQVCKSILRWRRGQDVSPLKCLLFRWSDNMWVQWGWTGTTGHRPGQEVQTAQPDVPQRAGHLACEHLRRTHTDRHSATWCATVCHILPPAVQTVCDMYLCCSSGGDYPWARGGHDESSHQSDAGPAHVCECCWESVHTSPSSLITDLQVSNTAKTQQHCSKVMYLSSSRSLRWPGPGWSRPSSRDRWVNLPQSSLTGYLEIRTPPLISSVCFQKVSWSLSAANAPKVKPLVHCAGWTLSHRVSSDQLSVRLSLLQTPQFVDIDLEEDEDSSDEEYCPDEQEEDDTADEVSDCCHQFCPLAESLVCHGLLFDCGGRYQRVCAFFYLLWRCEFKCVCLYEQTLPSDADSLSSPPKMHQRSQNNLTENQQIDEALQVRCPKQRWLPCLHILLLYRNGAGIFCQRVPSCSGKMVLSRSHNSAVPPVHLNICQSLCSRPLFLTSRKRLEPNPW